MLPKPPPLRILRYPEQRRVLVQLFYSALGKEAEERLDQVGASYPGGGYQSPEWLTDYQLRLDAVPGERVIGDFDATRNVMVFPTPKGKGHVISMDFGASEVSQTAALVAAVTPSTILVYAEWVKKRLPTRLHKERMRDILCQLRQGELDREFRWEDHFEVIGDVSGIGYRVDYADEPYPMQIGVPSRAEGWRNVEANEALLNSLCRLSKRCCYREFPTRAQRCEVCNQELKLLPGIVFHPRCVVVTSQIPAQVRDEEGKRKKVPRDALDACLYLARWAQSRAPRLQVEQKESKAWWLPPQEAEGPLAQDEEAQRAYKGGIDWRGAWI